MLRRGTRNSGNPSEKSPRLRHHTGATSRGREIEISGARGIRIQRTKELIHPSIGEEKREKPNEGAGALGGGQGKGTATENYLAAGEDLARAKASLLLVPPELMSSSFISSSTSANSFSSFSFLFPLRLLPPRLPTSSSRALSLSLSISQGLAGVFKLNVVKARFFFFQDRTLLPDPQPRATGVLLPNCPCNFAN